MRTSTCCSSLVAGLLWLWLVGARAQPEDAFSKHYELGRALYQAQYYEQSIREFEAAYQIQQLPRLLFNIGQAHLRLGHGVQALAYYQRFREAEAQLEGEAAQILDKAIAEARALADKEMAAERERQRGEAEARQAEERARGEKAERERAARTQQARALWTHVDRERSSVRGAIDAELRRLEARRRRNAGILLGAAGAGLLAIAGGLILFSLDGRQGCLLNPPRLQCPTVFSGRPGGIGLTVVGAAAVVGTGIGIWLEQREGARDVRAALLRLNVEF